MTPAEALADVLDADPQAAVRQVAAVDATGRAAAHTGSECIAHAGHVTGDGFSVQANMMLDPGVPEAMATAFTAERRPARHAAARRARRRRGRGR